MHKLAMIHQSIYTKSRKLMQVMQFSVAFACVFAGLGIKYSGKKAGGKNYA